MTIALAGLVVFIVVIGITVGVLLIDGCLWLSGEMTITKYVRKHPIWIFPIVSVLLIAVAGLIIHFLA